MPPAMPTSRATTPVPPVSWRMKWAFGLGSSAESIVITTTSAFLMLFYNQVRGLDPAAISC